MAVSAAYVATVAVRVDERVGDLLFALAAQVPERDPGNGRRSRMTRRFFWALTARLTLAISCLS